jgi:DNA-directed RNA polymerase specialized sigma24 family protein
LLAGPLPGRIERFLRRYHPRLRDVVDRFEASLDRHRRAAAWCLAIGDDLAREMCVIAIRNAESWYAQWCSNGANVQEQWVAFLIGKQGRTLKKLYERRTKHVPTRVFSRSEQERPWIEQFSDGGWPQPCSFASRVDPERVHRAIAALPPLLQRCVRLKYGLFPALAAWSEKRIGRNLQLPPREVKQKLAEATAELKKRLAEG